MMSTFTESDDVQLATLVGEGLPWKEIARRMDRPLTSVWQRARRQGLHEPRSCHRRVSEAEQDAIIRAYRDGERLSAIAERMQRTVGSVSAVLSRAGIATRRAATGPVRRRTDGTRQCRVCGLWLVDFAFASAHEGTCRECRNEATRARRHTQHVARTPTRPPGPTRPRRAREWVRAADLLPTINELVGPGKRYETVAAFRSVMNLTPAQWRRLQKGGETRIDVFVADRILTDGGYADRLEALVCTDGAPAQSAPVR